MQIILEKLKGGIKYTFAKQLKKVCHDCENIIKDCLRGAAHNFIYINV